MAIKSSNQITFTEHKKIIEIQEYYLATASSSGVTTETAGWTTDIQTIDYTNKYLWNYEKVLYSLGEPDISEPVIIGVYGSSGKDGRGIVSIDNYYAITATTDTTPSDWKTIVPTLSPENKFLWNYEKIIYTDNSETETEPAIIGAYGDSGADGGDVVTFEIYSTQGFMFKENLQSIELKIAAFKGHEPIVGAMYTWEWWNEALNDGNGGYEGIHIEEGMTGQSLIIYASDQYACANLKCTMRYEDNVYEDYITLTNEIVIYNAVVRFFNGSNIFGAHDPYLVAYVDLYQNNTRIETVAAQEYCTGVSYLDTTSGVITSSITGNFTDGYEMYFICRDGDGEYYPVLGKYTSGVWIKTEYALSYTYKNTFNGVDSNIIVIPKERVNKAQNIDFSVLKNDVEITSTYTMVIDSNDPIIGSVEPSNPVANQLWLDTSVNPSSLKMYNLATDEWINCAEHAGNVIHTSQPTSYIEGDLWILSIGETCEITYQDGTTIKHEAGTMLKATETSKSFNSLHWVDADQKITELKNNISQFFNFDPSRGLTIGQTDDKFYVNITSNEMGFYDNSQQQNQKVVSISSNAANIIDLTVEKNFTVTGDAQFNDTTTFNADVTIHKFSFIQEDNGSLSLVLNN